MPPDPNDQMVDPQVSNDDLEAWLAELEEGNTTYDFSTINPTAVPVPTATDPAPGEPPAEPDPEEPPDEPEPPATPDDYFTINGNQFAREDIERLYNFDQYLRANPDAAQRVAAAIAPPSTVPPQPSEPPVPAPEPETPSYTPPTPPEYLDLEDPSQKFLWERHVAVEEQLHNQNVTFQRYIAQQQAAQQEANNRQASIDMETALTTFRDSHPGLNDEDISSIRKSAGTFLPAMMQQLPPVAALVRSMEVAAWAEPSFRPRLESDTPAPTTTQKSSTRKQRLSQISGSPRSAPKTEPRVQYSTDKDMVNALANAIAESGFNGN